MVNLRADFKVKIKNGLVELPDTLSKITPQSFMKMICNPDLRFKFALKHNLNISNLDDDEVFASKFVNDYDSWLKYSKASKALIITILTQHPRTGSKTIFKDFQSLQDVAHPMIAELMYTDSAVYLREILSNEFTIDFLNFITSSQNYSIEKINPFIFKNILFFCLTFQLITYGDCWSQFKLPLETGDPKQKFTYKSIMSSFLHAQQNWFLYACNFESICTTFGNLSFDNHNEVSIALKDFTILFFYLNIISYIKHAQCMPEDSPYMRIKAFITALEYMNTKVKDTFGTQGLSPFFCFHSEFEISSYVDCHLQCDVDNSNYEDFIACINRMMNPIYNSLNNSPFCFIDSTLYNPPSSDYTQSFKRSCRDTYVFGFQETNDYHKSIVYKKKSPILSCAFTDPHYALTRHKIASRLYNLNPQAIFSERLSSKINNQYSIEINSTVDSFFRNIFNLCTARCFNYYDDTITIQDFSPFFIPKANNGLTKLISDAPSAPLNWLNNNSSVFLVVSNDSAIPSTKLTVNDTYNHSSATSNGLKMNNCIDRFTLPVSAGITEVIVFKSSLVFLSASQVNMLFKLTKALNIVSEIKLLVDAFAMTNQSLIGYEGGIRQSSYSVDYSYHQFNAHSNYNYTLDTYVKSGHFISKTFPLYAILSNYLLSLPSIQEASDLLEPDNQTFPKIVRLVNLLIEAQKGVIIQRDLIDDVQHVFDALELISTISEAYLLESYYQEYVKVPETSPPVLDKNSIINTMDFVSLDANSIYLNPSKTPSLYSYTDFFITSNFRNTPEVEDTSIPISISISTEQNIPVNVNLFGL